MLLLPFAHSQKNREKTLEKAKKSWDKEKKEPVPKLGRNEHYRQSNIKIR